VYRNANWLSANNPALLAYCKRLAITEVNGSVDLPPLDTDRFSAVSSQRALIPQNDILYMGSFFYFSGLPEVIQRFSEIAPIGVRLHLVGGGEQDLELRELVRQLGLEDRVIFHGFVAFSDLPKTFLLAQVAINPMEKSEVSNLALPNKVLQYLASGMRVVSTELVGLASTIESSSSLFLEESPSAVTDRAVEIATSTGGPPEKPDSVPRLLQKLSYETTIKRFEERLVEVLKSEDLRDK
jgi:glycosyltransferase involved in cell wall biosynthesis